MHILSFDVRSQNALVDTYSTTTMSDGMEWLKDSALTGDLVVISEMYKGVDGQYDYKDHVSSFVIDDDYYDDNYHDVI